MSAKSELYFLLMAQKGEKGGTKEERRCARLAWVLERLAEELAAADDISREGWALLLEGLLGDNPEQARELMHRTLTFGE